MRQISRHLMPEAPSYLEQLTHVNVPSPARSSDRVVVGVNKNLIQRLAAARKTTELFAYSYLVCGIPPQVNLVGYHERNSGVTDTYRGLQGAHALFRDLRRPMIDDGVVEHVFIYVLSPRFSYRYIPNMVCCAQRIDAPPNAVFVVYIRFDATDYSDGEIIGWDWVPADPQNPRLPENYAMRYGDEVWNNG